MFEGAVNPLDRKKEFYDIRYEIKSNLPLQMCLYLNLWVFPIWFFTILMSLNVKYYQLSDVYKFVCVAVSLIMLILEIVRLYLGYSGNLSEKIPELASFCMISTLMQLPLEIYLVLDENTKPQRSETISNVSMICLIIIEIITGFVALKKSANHHKKRFYLAQLYGIKEAMRQY